MEICGGGGGGGGRAGGCSPSPLVPQRLCPKVATLTVSPVVVSSSPSGSRALIAARGVLALRYCRGVFPSLSSAFCRSLCLMEYTKTLPYSWLFSRALFFTSLLSLSISRKWIFAMSSICVLLLKYFKVLYFMNLVCTTKFLKYKFLEKIQLYVLFFVSKNVKTKI